MDEVEAMGSGPDEGRVGGAGDLAVPGECGHRGKEILECQRKPGRHEAAGLN